MTEARSAVGHRSVTPDAVATFAALTGDYARIHVDQRLGEATPAGRGFAHGLLGASWALGALTLHAPERVGCGEPELFVGDFGVRFRDVVRFGDTLALRWNAAPPQPGDASRTEFELLDHDERVVTSGHLGLRRHASKTPQVAPWPGGATRAPAEAAPLAAEDLLERGPRGASRVRTLSESDVVAFAGFTGELNPLYLDAPFAEGSPFGGRIAPPMLCFCLGFSVWLRELMKLPMTGSESSAGHLGDRWQVEAPVLVGDTLEARYRPLALRRSRSQPSRGIATFGLQLVNQCEVVALQGEIDMMLSMREEAGDS